MKRSAAPMPVPMPAPTTPLAARPHPTRTLRRRLLAWLGPGLLAADRSAAAGGDRPSGAPARTDWPGSPWVHPALPPELQLAFPRDHGAHPAFRTEWWYLTAWLDGRGFQLTFFRSRTAHPEANPSRFAPKQLLFAHAALMLPAIGHPLVAERMARLGHPGTRMSAHETDLALGDWSLARTADDRYRARVRTSHFEADLSLDSGGRPPWRQGDGGRSRKGPRPDQASGYYSRTGLRVSGELMLPEAGRTDTGPLARRPVGGIAWFDHEWSTTLLDDAASGWDWVGLNLDDGRAFVAFRIRRRDGAGPTGGPAGGPAGATPGEPDGEPLWQYAAERGRDDRIRVFDGVRFTPLRRWRSPRTRAEWPVAMRIEAEALSLRLEPLFDDQELDSRATTGNVYWEGAVTVFDDRRGDRRRIGLGYLELTGYHERLRL